MHAVNCKSAITLPVLIANLQYCLKSRFSEKTCYSFPTAKADICAYG